MPMPMPWIGLEISFCYFGFDGASWDMNQGTVYIRFERVWGVVTIFNITFEGDCVKLQSFNLFYSLPIGL